jgi:hypothetical protein
MVTLEWSAAKASLKVSAKNTRNGGQRSACASSRRVRNTGSAIALTPPDRLARTDQPGKISAHRARLRQERLVRMKISHARLRPYGGPPITRGNTGSRLMENDFDRESRVNVLYSIPRCQAGLV